jgi:hypothetical protein
MAPPLIQGCIDELIKLVILDSLPSLCQESPKHPLCKPEFRQELTALPRCDVYRAPKQTRKLSDYQKHLSVCMSEQPFKECVRRWKENEHMDAAYKGSGYTGQ